MCKGNSAIAEILKKEYNIKNLSPFEEIDWEITEFSDTVSRVKITSKTGAGFCCPVYAMFDGSHVAFYGDYGDWLSNCTWDANVYNLRYNSPYYQLEKLEHTKQKEFNNEKCVDELLKIVRESQWYDDLTLLQQEEFEKNIKEGNSIICYEDALYEYEDVVNEIMSLYSAAQESETEWFWALRNVDSEIIENIFGYEEYELYNIGNKAPGRFFIILYMLSVVANAEKEVSGSGDK